MSKGIAIRTILLLVVGLLVAGILIYLVYSFTATGQLSVYECRVRLTELCTQCNNIGFGDYTLNSTLTGECSKYSEFTGWGIINNCNNANTDDLCKNLGVT